MIAELAVWMCGEGVIEFTGPSHRACDRGFGLLSFFVGLGFARTGDAF